MSFIMRPIRFASTGHIIEGSALFNGSTAKLSRTFGTPTNNKVWSFHCIAKFPDATSPATQKLLDCSTGSSAQASVTIDSNGVFRCFDYTGSFVWDIQSTANHRDPAAYYLFSAVVDTRTGVAAADKVKLYVNLQRVTDFSTETHPADNAVSQINSAITHNNAMRDDTSGNIFHGYRARDVFTDGTATEPTELAEVTADGFIQINDASGLTFGTNGFLIEGGANVAAGVDSSQGGTLADQQLRFLCSFDGSDAATSSTDDSTYGQAITFTADAQLDTAQKKFGTASLLLDGTGDFVSIPDTSIVEIGSQDFTIDMQVRFTTLGAIRTLMGKWHSTGNNRSFLLYWENSASQLQFLVSSSGSSVAATIGESWSPSTNTWYHVAVERTGGKIYLYVDGTMLGSGTANTTAIFDAATPLTFGSYQGGHATASLIGHIDEPRFIIGDGVYGGSSFTAPSAAYSNPTAGNSFIKTGTITATNDSPTNSDDGYGNYCTANPLIPLTAVFTNGNLTSTTVNRGSRGTLSIPPTGKWYFEYTAGNAYPMTGLQKDGGVTNTNGQVSVTLNLDYAGNAAKLYDNASISGSYGATYGSGDVIGVACDADAGTLTFYKNNSTQGVAKSGMDYAADTWFPHMHHFDTGTHSFNFGSVAFTYTPPSNHLALSTANLSTPDVINYEDEYYIEAGISHSNGSTTAVTLPKTVSGGAMARIKRTNTTGDWYVFNTVRGNNKFTLWNSTAAEDTSTFNDQTLSGTTFTIPSAMASGTYLLECFFVGTYFAIGNETSNGSGGYTYTHNMGEEVGMVLDRAYVAVGGNAVYHKSLGVSSYLLSESSAASATASNWMTPSTTNVVRTGGTASKAYITYVWANSGPFLFGVYDSNLNADGPMINLSGSPATFGAKRNDGSWNWVQASQILGDNENYQYLENNNTTAVNSSATVNEVDFLSNGMKMRDAGNNNFNGTAGADHLYWAFGIQPMTDGSMNQSRAGAVQPYDQAYGGNTIKRVGNFWVHTFTSSGTFTPHKAMDVEYLVVAGGGGAGSNRGGGGGAGGYRTGTGLSVSAQAYAITVGAGGAGGPANSAEKDGSKGSNSVFSSITSTGGGFGAGRTTNTGGGSGGSGGGSGSGESSTSTTAGAASPSGQGNAGGSGVGSSSSPGGGGAGEVGFSAVGTAAGEGGDGLASSITGTSTYYSGGGGGSSDESNGGKSGGLGGGGAGGHGGQAATAGTANTGGGGGTSGGKGSPYLAGGAGGSGVVIIKYAIG